MRSRGWWLLLSALAVPTRAPAQTVKAADLAGGWIGEVEMTGPGAGTWPAWMVLWPDGLWAYVSQHLWTDHGGARWRLVGDTLWLANDFLPYFHPMIDGRKVWLREKYGAIGVIDTAIIKDRPPYRVPDSTYWSKAFRDSTTACDGVDRRRAGDICSTWVYKVSIKDQRLHLVLLRDLSRRPEWGAVKAVFKRDSLVGQLDWTLQCEKTGQDC